LFRKVLKMIACATVMTISVAHAEAVTDSGLSGANGGASTVTAGAPKLEEIGTAGTPTMVTPTVNILSGPALMEQMLSGRRPLAPSAMPPSSIGHQIKVPEFSLNLPTNTVPRKLNFFDVDTSDPASDMGFAMPEIDFNSPSLDPTVSWNGNSRKLKVRHGGKLLNGNDDWSYLDRGAKYRGGGTKFVRRVSNDNEVELAVRPNSCAPSVQEQNARLLAHKGQGLGDKLAAITQLIFSEFAQMGRFIACML